MTKRSVTKKPKLTQWFDGSVKPVRDGVYQRLYNEGRDIGYAKYKYGQWYCYRDSINRASSEKSITSLQNRPWRGLAVKP